MNMHLALTVGLLVFGTTIVCMTLMLLTFGLVSSLIWIIENWTHDTIAEMQAKMLREVWAKWLTRDFGVRRNWMSCSDKDFEPGFTRIYLTNADFDEPLKSPSEVQLEIDRLLSSAEYERNFDRVMADAFKWGILDMGQYREIILLREGHRS